MQLALRVAAIDAGVAGPARDVVVELDEHHDVAALVRALADRGDRCAAGALRLVVPSRSTAPVEPATPVVALGLARGETVWLAAAGQALPRRRVYARPAMALDCVGGVGAGRTTVLHPGRYTVGSSNACDVVSVATAVAPRHADVVVTETLEVSIAPWSGAPDGADVLVDGVPIDGAVPVGPDQVIRLGDARLRFRRLDPVPPARAAGADGAVAFRRTPYRPVQVPSLAPVAIGSVPEAPSRRRVPVLSALAPLAAGVAMFAFTAQVQFLVLTLVSPLVLVGNAIGDRRSGRRAHRAALAEFHDSLTIARAAAIADRRREIAARHAAAPDLADLARRADERRLDLWPRGRRADDLLRLRVGLGPARLPVEIQVAPGGDADRRHEVEAALAGADAEVEVPVTVDLVHHPVVGVHGPPAGVDALVASLLVQLACLHSPDDVAIAFAVPLDRLPGWAHWVPHVVPSRSRVPGRLLAGSPTQCATLVASLVELAERRTGCEAMWPRLVVFVDPNGGADLPALSRLLEVAPAAGVSIVWLAERPAAVPHQATTVLQVGSAASPVAGTLWTRGDTTPPRPVTLDLIDTATAERVALALAPLRDIAAGDGDAAIPVVVDLFDCLGRAAIEPDAIAARWSAPSPYALEFPIGMGAGGPVVLDLVRDGPHTVIAGTSGAGKSELLQSMVAGLAAAHPPERLTFLFVDYKGGAGSHAFQQLPHTVGHVTNLDAGLAQRALTSLRAELRHRMALLEGRAKDLAEMLAVAPLDAPPSLVIVVDEFATLVTEIPEFVAGIVDVAQRGRSLGIHLVLATQRPSGSVDEHILANTNLRICLRLMERSESNVIVGAPDAAEIPVGRRGLAVARIGGGPLVRFQTAFGGAAADPAPRREEVVVVGREGPRATDRPDAVEGRDQLEATVDAVVAAHRRAGGWAPRRPWCAPLPELVLLADLVADARDRGAGHPGRHVVLGLADRPERQSQCPLVVDLERGGGLLVFGTGGAGKTTLLRTVAASIERSAPPGAVEVLAFDLASRGLAALAELPSVVAVATADEPEAISRHLLVLEREIERRRRLLGDARAEHLSAYLDGGGVLSRIVVLVDGIGGLGEALADATGRHGAADRWIDRFVRIVVEGRQVGVHAVVTADRRNAVPARLHAAIAERLLLRHADEQAYVEHGVAASLGAAITVAGRARSRDGALVQVACVAADHRAGGQAEALAAIARDARRPHRGTRAATPALASHALPERVAPGGAERRRLTMALGVADVTGATVDLDLRWSHAVVTGRPRSGRSTALATMATTLGRTHEVHVLGPPVAGLVREWPGAVRDARATAALLDRLADRCELGEPVRPVVLVVDDADELDGLGLGERWARVLATGRVHVVAAAGQRALLGFATDPLVATLKRSRRQLVLQPDDPVEFLQLTGVPLPDRPGVRWVAGRGVLVADRAATVLQVYALDPAPARLVTRVVASA